MATKRLRGNNINILNADTEENIKALADYGFDHARLTWVGPSHDIHIWQQGMQDNQFRLEQLSQTFRDNNLKFIINIHHWPFVNQNYNQIFDSSEIQENFIARWQSIAEWFKDDPMLLGYELMNEPGVGRINTYLDLMKRTAIAIRLIDPNTKIIIHSPGTTMDQFLRMKPLKNIPNIGYSFHTYDWPHIQFQGCTNRKSKFVWGAVQKNSINQKIRKIKAWQKTHDVKNEDIFVTEIACCRSSGFNIKEPNARKFFNHILHRFNQAKWNYDIHGFRDSSFWDYELGADPENTERYQTDIMRIVKKHIQQ